MHVTVHAANIHDRIAGGHVFKKALEKYPPLQGFCADAGYRKTLEEFVTKVLKKKLRFQSTSGQGGHFSEKMDP